MDGHERRLVEREVERKLDFAPYASVQYVSALHGSGIAELVKAALLAHKNAGAEFATPRLTRVLEDAMEVNPPPLVRGRQVRLRYAHQGGRYPLLVVVHGTQAQRLPDHYKRYLENSFREALRLRGTPARRAAHDRESVRAAGATSSRRGRRRIASACCGSSTRNSPPKRQIGRMGARRQE